MKKYVLLFYVVCLSAKVSYQPDDCLSYLHENMDMNVSPFVTSFYSPGHNLKQLILALVHSETKGMRAALYRLTDAELAQAIVDAHKRGVDIEIIVDASSVYDKYGKVHILKNAGVPVFIFPSSFFAIFHNKFFVFFNNLYEKHLLWTGSANATGAGLTRNEENVIILDDETIITRYCQQFERLKQNLHKMKVCRRKADSKKERGKIEMRGLHYYNSFLAWFPGYSSLKKNQAFFSDWAIASLRNVFNKLLKSEGGSASNS